MAQMANFTTSDGERIAYFIDDFTDPWTQAPVLLLIHSLMGHSGRFYAMVPALARHFRVVRMDMRGHGASSLPAEDKPLTLDRLTADVAELLDHLAVPHVHLLGNSAGGYLSQTLAITAAHRVRSLCLFGSTPGLKRSGAANWLPQIESKGLRPFLAETISDRFPVKRENSGKIEWFLNECAKNDQNYIILCLKIFTSLDWSNRLKEINCPTMIVAGGSETVGEADHYREMSREIPESTLVYYDTLPHNICDIVPERCSDDVLRFLRWNFREFDQLP